MIHCAVPFLQTPYNCIMVVLLHLTSHREWRSHRTTCVLKIQRNTLRFPKIIARCHQYFLVHFVPRRNYKELCLRWRFLVILIGLPREVRWLINWASFLRISFVQAFVPHKIQEVHIVLPLRSIQSGPWKHLWDVLRWFNDSVDYRDIKSAHQWTWFHSTIAISQLKFSSPTLCGVFIYLLWKKICQFFLRQGATTNCLWEPRDPKE